MEKQQMNVASCKGELWREGERGELFDRPVFSYSRLYLSSHLEALLYYCCEVYILLRSHRSIVELRLEGNGGGGARELGEKYSLAVLFGNAEKGAGFAKIANLD